MVKNMIENCYFWGNNSNSGSSIRKSTHLAKHGKSSQFSNRSKKYLSLEEVYER